jgi:hypothetical protein
LRLATLVVFQQQRPSFIHGQAEFYKFTGHGERRVVSTGTGNRSWHRGQISPCAVSVKQTGCIHLVASPLPTSASCQIKFFKDAKSINRVPVFEPRRRKTKERTGGLNPFRGVGKINSFNPLLVIPKYGSRSPALGKRKVSGVKTAVEGDGETLNGSVVTPAFDGHWSNNDMFHRHPCQGNWQ